MNDVLVEDLLRLLILFVQHVTVEIDLGQSDGNKCLEVFRVQSISQGEWLELTLETVVALAPR